MKQVFAFFLMCCLFLFSPSVFANELENIKSSEFRYTTDIVNLRSDSTINSGVIGTVNKNTKVKVLRVVNEWSFITFGNFKGYISTDYLTLQPSVSDKAQIPNVYHTLGYHTVKSNDTLKDIAFKHNLPIHKLMFLNSLVSDDLTIGQILKVTTVQTLKGKKVVIDPGHGGTDSGATKHGVVEKIETMDVSLKLKRQLESEGAEVIMTADKHSPSMKTLPLASRAYLSYEVGADLFISIHFNSNPNKEAKGTETYYNKLPFKDSSNPFPAESKALSEEIQSNLVRTIDTKNIGVKESDFHVLRNNSVPSALVEIAFISNRNEAEKIKTNTFKEKASFGISQGVIDYYRQ